MELRVRPHLPRVLPVALHPGGKVELRARLHLPQALRAAALRPSKAELRARPHLPRALQVVPRPGGRVEIRVLPHLPRALQVVLRPGGKVEIRALLRQHLRQRARPPRRSNLVPRVPRLLRVPTLLQAVFRGMKLISTHPLLLNLLLPHHILQVNPQALLQTAAAAAAAVAVATALVVAAAVAAAAVAVSLGGRLIDILPPLDLLPAQLSPQAPLVTRLVAATVVAAVALTGLVPLLQAPPQVLLTVQE